MTKREWKLRALEAEATLTAARLGPMPTVDTLTICWAQRTVSLRGRTITAGPQDCLSMPLLNDQRIFAPHLDEL